MALRSLAEKDTLLREFVRLLFGDALKDSGSRSSCETASLPLWTYRNRSCWCSRLKHGTCTVKELCSPTRMRRHEGR